MNHGRFEQVSTPAELYQHPRSLYAAHFVGSVSQIPIDEVLDQQGDEVDFRFSNQTLKGMKMPGHDAMVGPQVALGSERGTWSGRSVRIFR